MEDRTCRVEGCAKFRRYPNIDLCNAHYLRNLRHGDPLATKRRVPTLSERFESKVIRPSPSGCWGWAGSFFKATGYALFNMPSPADGVWRPTVAHRVSYRLHVGEIPEGMQLDHLCRNRGCVNPAHLEPVTPGENVRRGYAPSAVSFRANRCHRGHEFTEANTYIRNRNGRTRRDCRECTRQRERRRVRRKA